MKIFGAGGIGGPRNGLFGGGTLPADLFDQRTKAIGLAEICFGSHQRVGIKIGLQIAVKHRASARRKHERRKKRAANAAAADDVKLFISDGNNANGNQAEFGAGGQFHALKKCALLIPIRGGGGEPINFVTETFVGFFGGDASAIA